MRIDSVLPPDNLLSQYIVTLATIYNDLMLGNQRLLEGFTNGAPATCSLYDFRLVSSHYREACKFLHESEKCPEIVAFINSLSGEAQDIYQGVRATFDPWTGSFVESKVKPLRDAFLHYPELRGKNKDERTEQALRELGKLEVSEVFFGLDEQNRWKFADELVVNMALWSKDMSTLQMDEDQHKYHLKSLISTVAKYSTSLMEFAEAAILPYLSTKLVSEFPLQD